MAVQKVFLTRLLVGKACLLKVYSIDIIAFCRVSEFSARLCGILHHFDIY